MTILKNHIQNKQRKASTASTSSWQNNAYATSQDWLDADSNQEDQKRAQPAAAAPLVTTPTTPTAATNSTSTIPITQRLIQLLGKAPEEKAAEEAELKKAAQKKEAWGHFFDGLRYLGQAAGVAQGARVAPMSDTGSYFANQYKQEKTDRDALDTSSAAYRIKLYELQQQEKKNQQALEELKRTHRRQDEADARAERETQAREANAGLTAKGKEIDNALKQGKLDNQKQEQKDAHDKAQKIINKTSSGSSKSSSKKSSASQARSAASKEANQWGKSHPRDAKTYWASHARTTANEQQFNKQMRSKYSKGGKSGGKTETSSTSGKYGGKFK